MLVATALVLMMTPALGLFYAGLVRSKNTLNTFMMCVGAIAVATVTWAAVGYSLAFDGTGDLIGGLGNGFLSGVDFAPREGTDDPRARLHGLPGDLLHHHRRPRLRRGGRADAVRLLPRLRGALVGAGLRGPRPLGLRRRLAAGGRHPRLRRRRAGRDGLRLLGPGGGARRRRPQGLRAPGPAPPQRDLRPARRRPALVRLVRLQRRQRLLHRQSPASSPSPTPCSAPPARSSSGSPST